MITFLYLSLHIHSAQAFTWPYLVLSIDSGIHLALLHASSPLTRAFTMPCLSFCFALHALPAVQDGSRVVRTLASVEAEQEVTVDYCGGGFLYQPSCRRRAKLLSGYEFVCDCMRCASPPSGGDDTRRFPCCWQRGGGNHLLTSPRGGSSNSGGSGGDNRCAGYHLVHHLDVGNAAPLLPCSSCGHVASAAACAELLDDEAELLARLDRVDATRELRLARVLQPPHPHHAAAARIGMLQWELFHRTPGMCDAQAAARAAGEAIACLEAIRPLPSKDHAAAYLALGDSLLRGARMGGAVAPHRLLAQAQEAYQKGVRTLVLLYGPSHPSSEAAARALAAAQCSMLTVNAAAMEGFAAVAEEDAGCSFCGGAMLDGKALLHCQVCQVAAYCCEEHRRAQWTLHEKTCRAPY